MADERQQSEPVDDNARIIELQRGSVKLTCWKCGRYANDIAVEGETVFKTNCKSSSCNHVCCWYLVGRPGQLCVILRQWIESKPVLFGTI